MSVTLAERFLAMSPFLAASVLYGGSPELTKVARWRITSLISDLDKRDSENKTVPPHLSEDYIGDYLEYAVDVAQVVPMVLLPLIGVLISLHLGLDPGIAWLIFAGSALILIIVTTRFLRQDPIEYVSKKFFGRYTLLSMAGIIANLIAAGLVGAFL